ncbi:hypothetical protein GCM10023200_53670 [Actinomycetospora chlora]|uniref:DUF998 domain-containing protein n=1 Tax=Actinomycetospora chlora TaxID=663608 RepID=A0ABP9CE36_9PSEU
MTTITAPAAVTTSSTTTTRTRTRLAVLATGLVGWCAVSVAQAATRQGFDILVHPLSQLSTGDLGWVQITNFVVAGVLCVVGAGGLRSALAGTPGATWAPRLVRGAGIGLAAAGVLVMDPGNGCPVGAPTGITAMSWHALGHMVSGTLSFTCLIAACFVLGRHFTRTGRRGPAVASRVAGLALVVGWGWAMGGGVAGTLTLAIGAIATMLWIAAVALGLRRAA